MPVAKLTIFEIANLAQVSTGTVSRVLNNRPGVSEQTRERVLQVVGKTGFVPDAGARRLARGRQQLVGVAPFNESAIANPYYAYLLDAIQESIYRLGFTARVLQPGDGHRLEDDCVGFIVPGVHLDDSRVRRLSAQGTPVVVIGQVIGQNVPWIDVDNRGGIHQAVEHLVRLGHRHIAHLTGSPIGQTSQERLEAYQEGLQKAGLPQDRRWELDGEYSMLGAYRVVRTFFENASAAPITAIVSASDEMAHGAMLALQDLGHRVPTEISVTGFDDLPFAAQLRPGLTTVRQPILDVGHMAGELLLEALEGKTPRQLRLPTQLMVRGSTATLNTQLQPVV